MLAVPAYALLLFALAAPLPVAADVIAALFAGASLEVFTVCWATTMQQEIPPAKLSRVASYDALGGTVLAPAATAIAGPLATTFSAARVLAAGGTLVAVLPVLTLLVPEVRQMRRRQPGRNRSGNQ